jgi:hypothetical protein
MFSQALLRSTRQAIAASRTCKPTTPSNALPKALYSDKPAGQPLSPATTETTGIQPATSSDDAQVIPAGLTSGAPGRTYFSSYVLVKNEALLFMIKRKKKRKITDIL